MTSRVIVGDCLDVMRGMEADSIDSIVSDPPYGLAFMGKLWDHGVPGVPFWEAALRVAKPGAHLLAFGGTRTFHRLTCAIEDAGWEIRDCLSWLYGSGFPKSLDVSKALDSNGAFQREMRRAAVVAVQEAGLIIPKNNLHDWTKGEHAPGRKWWAEFCRWMPTLASSDRSAIERKIVKTVRKKAGWFTSGDIYSITAPSSNIAIQWEGWGTALKPAWEPIILARKPLIGTVAENVEKYSTGALNIDNCRVFGPKGNGTWGTSNKTVNPNRKFNASPDGEEYRSEQSPMGRWPANVVLDEEAAGLLDPQSGVLTSGANPTSRGSNKFASTYGDFAGQRECAPARGLDSGGASRFYYTAKASRGEREAGLGAFEKKKFGSWSTGKQSPGTFQNPNTERRAKNHHPTVKPIALMGWLIKLVTPPGGSVLDPFCGSGSTGCAAALEGFRFVGIEKEAEYVEIARARIAHWASLRQPSLFGGPA